MSAFSALVRKRSDSGSSWVTRDVLTLLLAQLLFGFAWSMYLLLPKFYTNALGVGPELLGQISATGGVAGLLAVPFAGYGLDRLGRVFFFRLGVVFVIVMSVGFMTVERVGFLLYALHAMFMAAFVFSYNGAAALITDYAPPEHMGRAIGWLGGAHVLMNAGASIVAEPLSMNYGWNTVFVLGGVMGGLTLLLSLRLRESERAPVQPDSAVRGRGIGVPVQTLPLLLVTVVVGATFIAMFSFVQPYALSLGAMEIRSFLIGHSISAVGCRLILGGAGDRFGRDLVSAVAMAGYTLCALCMVGLEIDLLLLYGLLFGAAHGVLYPTLNALFSQAMPSSQRGLSMALFNGAFNLGGVAGGWGCGQLVASYGYPRLYQWVALLTLAGVATLLVLWGRRLRAVARS